MMRVSHSTSSLQASLAGFPSLSAEEIGDLLLSDAATLGGGHNRRRFGLEEHEEDEESSLEFPYNPSNRPRYGYYGEDEDDDDDDNGDDDDEEDEDFLHHHHHHHRLRSWRARLQRWVHSSGTSEDLTAAAVPTPFGVDFMGSKSAPLSSAAAAATPVVVGPLNEQHHRRRHQAAMAMLAPLAVVVAAADLAHSSAAVAASSAMCGLVGGVENVYNNNNNGSNEEDSSLAANAVLRSSKRQDAVAAVRSVVISRNRASSAKAGARNRSQSSAPQTRRGKSAPLRFGDADAALLETKKKRRSLATSAVVRPSKPTVYSSPTTTSTPMELDETDNIKRKTPTPAATAATVSSLGGVSPLAQRVKTHVKVVAQPIVVGGLWNVFIQVPLADGTVMQIGAPLGAAAYRTVLSECTDEDGSVNSFKLALSCWGAMISSVHLSGSGTHPLIDALDELLEAERDRTRRSGGNSGSSSIPATPPSTTTTAVLAATRTKPAPAASPTTTRKTRQHNVVVVAAQEEEERRGAAPRSAKRQSFAPSVVGGTTQQGESLQHQKQQEPQEPDLVQRRLSQRPPTPPLVKKPLRKMSVKGLAPQPPVVQVVKQ